MNELELPEHFEDTAVCTVLRKEDTQRFKQYPLTCGLAVKLRTALIRVIKRSVLKAAERKALPTEDICLYNLVEAFTSEKEFLRENWSSTVVFHTVVLELAIKAINLSPPLQRELSLHPLGKPRYVVASGVDANAVDSSGMEVVEVNGIKYPIKRPNVRNSTTGQPLRISIHFNMDFLVRVRQYHEATRRPEGTFESPLKSPLKAHLRDSPAADTPAEEDCVSSDTSNISPAEAELISALAELPKEVCLRCKGRRQVYCGDCWGARMTAGQSLLPPRIALPFNVVLLLHWQETLHKCTGVHVGALCEEGTFSVIHWDKALVPCCGSHDPVSTPTKVSHVDPNTGTQQLHMSAPAPLREDWKNAVESLDHTRDVLLFPCEDAELAGNFPWRSGDDTNGNTISNNKRSTECASQPANSTAIDASYGDTTTATAQAPHRWRLVVLEANWSYGKTMAMQIRSHREAVGLPPLRCVQLTDITGQYWKFQTEGHAAVSTIEAIAHTARAAGISQSELEGMLLLFQLQKYRMLKRIEDGGKVPRAVEVSGAGLGSWKELTDELDAL